MNTYLLLDIAASIMPEQEIVTCGDRRLSYSELTERTNRLASVLSSYGAQPGDRIGFIATGGSETLETFFAAFQLGASIVPINYRAKADELEYMIRDAGVKWLVIEKRYADLVSPTLTGTDIAKVICIGGHHPIGLEYEEALASAVIPMEGFADVDNSDLAILLYTSGTTNRPKGVMITYGQLTSYVMNHSEACDGTPKGSSLICVPSYHIAGATSLCNCIYSGRRMILLSQFDAGSWLQAVEKEKTTHAFLVPTMLSQVMNHPAFTSTDMNSLESLSYGAAPMPLPVIKKAIELFPDTVSFANAFGMTETTSTVCVLDPEDHKLNGTPEENQKKLERLASVGRPLPDVEILILNEDNEPAAPKSIGNVYVRTAKAMKGYWNRPEASEETLVNGWVNTNDMGWMDEDGYLFLCGRSSDMVIRGGENISPAEIESVLMDHPGVADVAVIGVPSLEWGEEVVAVVVPLNPQAPPEDELISFCSGRLASYKRPSKIEFAAELPRTSTGKILKRQLREQYDGKSSIKQ
ncbi:class I adenylate-forming enzyme family protein [Bacillus testis]|uniref:class I adenylate-forming enzyme family protein n=1 Tax=Bacillus testis TaxID=1622072 RepID=UPI00067F1320|nr:AMP-binding protein [Bacillus testis]